MTRSACPEPVLSLHGTTWLALHAGTGEWGHSQCSHSQSNVHQIYKNYSIIFIIFYKEHTEYEIIKTRSIIKFTVFNVIFDELLQRSLSLHQQYVSLKKCNLELLLRAGHHWNLAFGNPHSRPIFVLILLTCYLTIHDNSPVSVPENILEHVVDKKLFTIVSVTEWAMTLQHNRSV